MKPKVLFVVAPVVWQNMPLPGVAYLSEFLDINHIYNEVLDLNIQIYNESDENVRKNWLKRNIRLKNKILQTGKFLHEYIAKKKFTHIAFTTYNTNYLFANKLAEYIKKDNRAIKILFGGPAVFYFYHYNKNYLLKNNAVDYFIIGEGETAVLGIIENKITDKIIKNFQIKAIDYLPYPKYKKFNLKAYARQDALPVVMSRGCINKCKFCSERLLFSSYRVRDYKNVFNEIQYHYNKNNIRWFTFYDSIFNGNLKNIEGLLDLIIEKKIEISWDAQISVRNDMSNKLLKKFKKSGCINLFIGLETGSKEILERMNKRFTLSDAEKFFNRLSSTGLNFEVSLILNYYLENLHDFNDTVNFILNTKSIKKIAQINPYIYYPNTNVDITKGYNLFEGIRRVEEMKKILKKNNIRFTNSYINNLIK